MKVTIIRDDGYVSVDGRGFQGIDMSSLDASIHAVQWNGVDGEIEWEPDPQTGQLNTKLFTLDAFNTVLGLWATAADLIDNPQPLPIPDAAAFQIAAHRTSCRDDITGGVISAALGAAHTYPTGETDQLNLSGCVTESLLNDAEPAWVVPFWCADGEGLWDRRIHSHNQIRQVGKDVAAHVRQAQDKLKQLTDQVSAIASDAVLTDDEKRTAIAAVIW